MTIDNASLPDAEVVIVGYLKTLALPTGTYVSTEVPDDYDGSQYVVRVDRVGGPTDWPYADHPSVEISTWGPDRASALTLRNIVRGAMTWMSMAAADFTPFGAAVAAAAERNGPQWFVEEAYPPAGSYRFEVSFDLRSAG